MRSNGRNITLARHSTNALDGARILVVEDEALIAMDIQMTLEGAGAEVIGPAYTLSQAIDEAERENISAAVLDLRLGQDPVTAAARVLAGRGIPFIFYSGQADGDPTTDEWPDAPVIHKPANSGEIVRAIESLSKPVSAQ